MAEQLVYLTRYLRLGPGDVVLTGCPGTFAPVEPGDLAVVMIDGIDDTEQSDSRPGMIMGEPIDLERNSTHAEPVGVGTARSGEPARGAVRSWTPGS